MTLATWLAVVTICVLGAMSPGPSLAIVLKQTLTGVRRNGMITAVTHGLGVGVYAFLSILGLAAIITASPVAFSILQWGGAGYLAWLGVKGLWQTPGVWTHCPRRPPPQARPGTDSSLCC